MMNAKIVRLTKIDSAQATLDEDAHEHAENMLKKIEQHVLESQFILSADLDITLAEFQIQPDKESFLVTLTGTLNKKEFQAAQTFTSLGHGLDHVEAVLHPGHWFVQAIARMIVSRGSKQSSRQQSVRKIISSAIAGLTTSMNQAVGASDSRLQSRWSMIKLQLIIVLTISVLIYSPLFIMMFAEREGEDASLFKWGTIGFLGILVGFIISVFPTLSYFFFAMLLMPKEDLEKDPVGQSFMATIGVGTVTQLRVVGFIAALLTGAFALSALYFVTNKLWLLPF